jgi:hypothetical protein
MLIVKLISGEDVLGEVEGQNNTDCGTIRITNPVQVAVIPDPMSGKPGIGILPFPMHSDRKVKDKSIIIDKRNVVYYYTPAQDYIDRYKEIMGGIQVPSKQILMG